jgi:hypothetical protein
MWQGVAPKSYIIYFSLMLAVNTLNTDAAGYNSSTNANWLLEVVLCGAKQLQHLIASQHPVK